MHCNIVFKKKKRVYVALDQTKHLLASQGLLVGPLEGKEDLA